MAITSSYFLPPSIRVFSTSVTTPLYSDEPSSVVTYRLHTLRSSSSNTNSERVRAPIIQSTSTPWLCNHFTCGYIGAMPTPPPTKTNFFCFSSSSESDTNSDGRPSGPTTSRKLSPTLYCAILRVEWPITLKTIVTVPCSKL